jgi:hypothetical protein
MPCVGASDEHNWAKCRSPISNLTEATLIARQFYPRAARPRSPGRLGIPPAGRAAGPFKGVGPSFCFDRTRLGGLGHFKSFRGTVFGNLSQVGRTIGFERIGCWKLPASWAPSTYESRGGPYRPPSAWWPFSADQHRFVNAPLIVGSIAIADQSCAPLAGVLLVVRSTSITTGDRRRQANSLAKRKNQLATMEDRLLNAYLAGTVDEAVYTAKAAELKAEAARADEALARSPLRLDPERRQHVAGFK